MDKAVWIGPLSGDNLKSKTCPEPFDSAQDKLRRRIQNRKLCGLALGVLLFALSFPAEAQQKAKIPRIAYLAAGPASAVSARIEAFRQGLRELGYVEEKNIVIESRYSEGKLDRLPALAADLVRLKVDVILSGGPAATRPAKEATVTIPIVMAFDDDPVGSGFVASLARPGGNITGLATLAPEISGKQLELLKEIVPTLSRVAVLSNPDLPGLALRFPELQVEARELGITLQSMEVRNPNELVSAFEAATKERSDALFLPQPGFTNVHRKRIVDFAAKNRLPAMYPESASVEAGGLMSYGANSSEQYRRAATYVGKILKGAKPGDLPVEQPTKFELVVNLKTAKQIGLTVPPNVLARADKVIR